MTFPGSHDSHSVEQEVKLGLFGSQDVVLEVGGWVSPDPSPKRAFQGQSTHLFTDGDNTQAHGTVSEPDLGCPQHGDTLRQAGQTEEFWLQILDAPGGVT